MNGGTGIDGIGGCNAYLYTAMVDIPDVDNTRRPDDHTLAWSGNFCTLPKTPAGTDAIDGTFVIGRKLFMENCLLPELWALNKACDIYHSPPYAEEQSDHRLYVYHPYDVGKDPDHLSVFDQVFKLTNFNEKNDPDKVNGYRFRKVNTQGPIEKYNSQSNGCDVRMATRGRCTHPAFRVENQL